MPRVLLLRHGQSEWNAERRWQGLADTGLSALGEAQARAAAQHLRAENVTGLASSPLGRARQTAEIVARELGIAAEDIELVDDLRERDVGEWSGLTSDEIEARWPGLLDQWRGGTLAVLPGGEGDIKGRVVPAVERIARTAAAGATILVVTHGGVITAMEHALGVEPCRARNCCGRWLTVEADGGLIAGHAVVLADAEQAAETTAL